MGEIRVEALRAVAGLRRGEVREVEDTEYVQTALEAGHLRDAGGDQGDVSPEERDGQAGREQEPTPAPQEQEQRNMPGGPW